MSIDDIFSHLGYELVNDSGTGERFSCSYLLNSEGQMRYLWNRNDPKPYFLKFYSKSSTRARIIYALVSLVFFLRLQKVVFRSKNLVLRATTIATELDFDPSEKGWALFTGTPGPDRKLVLFNLRKDLQGSFTKIACSERSIQLIQKEIKALDLINGRRDDAWSFPKLIRKGNTWVELANIAKGKSTGGTWSEALNTYMISMLSEEFLVKECLSDFSWAQDCKSFLFNEDSIDCAMGLKEKLRAVLEIYGNRQVYCGPAHGDLTPWNVFQHSQDIGIVDWEHYNEELPVGFDLFHYFIQSQIHLHSERNSFVLKTLSLEWDKLCRSLGERGKDLDFGLYLASYLLVNCTAYIKQYQKKQGLSKNDEYAIVFWNTLLSSILRDTLTPRQLLLQDVFDYLHFCNYACVKVPGDGLKNLGQFSDVDILLEKDQLALLEKYLKTHPLVKKLHSAKRAYMSSTMIVLSDGQLLALDFIWRLQRKEYSFLDTDDVLSRRVLHKEGVFVFSLQDQARYYGYFYGLNKAKVPTKYQSYQRYLGEDGEGVSLQLSYQEPSEIGLSALVSQLKRKPSNTYLRRVCRYFIFLVFELFLLLRIKGMMLSFTGVDGAGKTTIINKCIYLIQKKYRRRVVVLHHRPRILPLLSSLKFGMKKAEEISTKQMPREGTNTSVFGSVFRFCYYFLDYFLGQLYVYFKYLFRGYIVIFDRYYYDMIVDRKRSNIYLNPSFIRQGLRFIYKPDLSLFLYAPPHIILSRKPELTEEEIVSLTEAYHSLFKKLKKGSKTRFVSIENLELSVSTDLIDHQLYHLLVNN